MKTRITTKKLATVFALTLSASLLPLFAQNEEKTGEPAQSSDKANIKREAKKRVGSGPRWKKEVDKWYNTRRKKLKERGSINYFQSWDKAFAEAKRRNVPVLVINMRPTAGSSYRAGMVLMDDDVIKSLNDKCVVLEIWHGLLLDYQGHSTYVRLDFFKGNEELHKQSAKNFSKIDVKNFRWPSLYLLSPQGKYLKEISWRTPKTILEALKTKQPALKIGRVMLPDAIKQIKAYYKSDQKFEIMPPADKVRLSSKYEIKDKNLEEVLDLIRMTLPLKIHTVPGKNGKPSVVVIQKKDVPASATGDVKKAPAAPTAQEDNTGAGLKAPVAAPSWTAKDTNPSSKTFGKKLSLKDFKGAASLWVITFDSDC